MLSTFDWLRRSRSGPELLATLSLLATGELKQPLKAMVESKLMGPPLTLFERPCQRCWVYPPVSLEPPWLCRTCRQIVDAADNGHFKQVCIQSVVVWGTVNRHPKILDARHLAVVPVFGQFSPDENHFLIVVYQKDLLTWLKELALYDSSRVSGVLQVFPTIRSGANAGFSQLFTLAAALQDSSPSRDLRVLLNPRPSYLLDSQMRKTLTDRNLALAEAIQMLEMVRAIRSLFGPVEQEHLMSLARMPAGQEQQFYWGRFMGNLSSEARDFIETWQLRHWPVERLKLLYDLKPFMVDFAS